ncbi:MAG: NADH-quinone oxidoreductase subunit L, partial [Pseudonocardiaceae bacterium]
WWGGRPVPVPAPVRRALGEWLRLERAADLLAVRPTMALARVLAAFDDRALHRTVLAVPAAGLWLARLSERRAELSMDNAVGAIVRTVRRLAALARRPQTGQLHQYYAQAAVALVVLALLVVFVRSLCSH